MPLTSRVLLVDDDDLFADATAERLRARGYAVETAYTLAQAAEIDPRRFDCVVADHQLPDGSGLTLASQVQAGSTRLVLVTGNPRIEAAIEAMRLGFRDFLQKPIELDQLLAVLHGLGPVEPMHRSIDGSDAPTPGRDADFERLARARCPLLITGETGCGKGHFARVLHDLGGAERPFVRVNCAAIPEALMEAELFGVERGAFTGAETRAGLIEAADQGTLFLDEIGDLPMFLQAKLLTFLDDGEYRRLGAGTARSARVRVISATNRDIDDAVASGRFRADLLHRLDVVRLELPPLRERKDFGLVAEALVARLVSRQGRAFRLAPGEIERLRAHAWPGNVRELANALERSALAAVDDDLLRPSRMVRTKATSRPSPAPAGAPPPSSVRAVGGLSVSDDLSLDRVERAHVMHVLGLSHGNRTAAAAALGIGVSTLRRKLAEWGTG